MTRITFEIEDELSRRRYEPYPEIAFSMAQKILSLCYLQKPLGKKILDSPTYTFLPDGIRFRTLDLIVDPRYKYLLADLGRHYEKSTRITVYVRKSGRRTNKDNGVDGIIIPCIVQLRFTPGRADENVSVYEFACKASQRGVSVATLTQAPHK